jgi:hypothetical protein
MVAEGKEYMFFSPWVIHHPWGGTVQLVLAINLLGDGLRDLTPPENRAFWCVYFISLRLTLALVDRASHAVATTVSSMMSTRPMKASRVIEIIAPRLVRRIGYSI